MQEITVEQVWREVASALSAARTVALPVLQEVAPKR
jgi:hypothetical protein